MTDQLFEKRERIAFRKWKEFFDAVESDVLGRSSEIKGIQLALLSRNHVAMLGPTGTGKSYLTSRIFDHIEDSSLFKIQCKKGTTEDALFGHPNYKRLRLTGKIRYLRNSKLLPWATFAFLDEFADLSDHAMRIPLQILFERECSLGPQTIKCPLHTAILTSNYMPENEVTNALWDRVLVKFAVSYIADVEGRMEPVNLVISRKMGEGDGACPKLSYGAIRILCELTALVTIPEAIKKAYLDIISEYEQKTGKKISDRRLGEIPALIQAHALNNQRMVADVSDLSAIKYGLIVNGDQTSEADFSQVMQMMAPKLKPKPTEPSPSGEDPLETLKRASKIFTAISNSRGANVVRLKHVQELSDTLMGLDVGKIAGQDLEDYKNLLAQVDQLKNALNV